MSITKPYTFTAGTKARANEVNDNFDTLYSQVNSNISNISQNALDIDNLDSNKADINGNSTEVFNCADATTNTHAVNKQTLFSAIGNTLNYIDGLSISKDSGSPEDTILVDPGSCYDSTQSKVLVLSSVTTKQNDNQGASTTYYVYIIGNSTASSIDILISSNSTTPTLPTGYTLYRKIGSYTTDSSAHIDNISNLSGTDKITSENKFASIGYCKLSNGLIIQWGNVSGMGNGTSKTATLPTAFTANNYSVAGSADYYQGAGDKGSTWRTYDYSTTSFKIQSKFEQSSGHIIWWIAIGY